MKTRLRYPGAIALAGIFSLVIELGAAFVTSAANADEAIAQPSNSAAATHLSDAEFIRAVSQALSAQIELSKIAANEAQTDKVREYANWILKDYTSALVQLHEAAAKINVDFTPTLDGEHRRIVESLRQKPGQQRDNSYLQQLKEQHDRLIALCERAHAETSVAAELRNYADDLLPTLRQYRKRAENLLQTTPTLSANF